MKTLISCKCCIFLKLWTITVRGHFQAIRITETSWFQWWFLSRRGNNLQSSHGEEVEGRDGGVSVYWTLKWPVLWVMIRHVISHYLWGLIDTICGDWALFPRSVEFHRSLSDSAEIQAKGEKDEVLFVFIYILMNKLEKDHKTSSVEGWKTKNQVLDTSGTQNISIFWKSETEKTKKRNASCSHVNSEKGISGRGWRATATFCVMLDWLVLVDQRLCCLDWCWAHTQTRLRHFMLLTVQCEP